MDSITESGVNSKVKVIRGGLGYIIKGQKEKWHGVALPKRARGDIKGFSRASARRLRETLALATYKGAESVVWGITLTIPGRILEPSAVRRLWHRWCVIIKQEYKEMPMVWRIELQRRKQAHWHCVVWLEGKGFEDTVAQADRLAARWRRLVREIVGVLPEDTDLGFDVHGVNLKCLKGSGATGLIDYLADHTSKHKRDQLGWQGRQWGVINRTRLDFEGEVVAEFSDRQHKKAARQFRRLQEHLRRDGVYTGGGVTPSGNVQRSVFGRDAKRLIDCYSLIDGAEKPISGRAQPSETTRSSVRGTRTPTQEQRATAPLPTP